MKRNFIYKNGNISGSAKLVTSGFGGGSRKRSRIQTMAMMLTGRILLCHIITLSLVCFLNKILIKSLDFMRHNNLFFSFLLDVHFLVNCTTRISTTKPSGMRCYGYKMSPFMCLSV